MMPWALSAWLMWWLSVAFSISARFSRPKARSALQENTQQNNQATTNKQEQTKQTAVKAETKKQGEKLPNTASNGVTMMLASAGLVLAGSILIFRRKKTNA